MTLPNLILNECDSTQLEANKILTLSSHDKDLNGFWVFSRRQLKGRGRLDRQWEGREGNLHLSIILGNLNGPPTWITWLPLLTAFTVLEVIKEQFNQDVQLKWPNDLYFEGKKLGGVLCEFKQKEYVICGIGCNLLSSPFEGGSCLRLLDSDALNISPMIAHALVNNVFELKKRPQEFLLNLKNKFWNYSIHQRGEQITWRGKKGKIVELGDQGELIIQEDEKNISLYSDDIT